MNAHAKEMTDELTAELLDAPDAQLIINRVQAVLNDEKKRRQAFYDWLQDDVKAEFINGESLCTHPSSVGICGRASDYSGCCSTT